jgi:hypothetical protein
MDTPNIPDQVGKTSAKRPRLSSEEFLADKPAIAELTEIDRWVCWRYEQRKGKETKPPVQVDGRYADSTDPNTWNTFDACYQAAFGKGKHDGIGFVLTNDDDIMAFDLDDCLGRDGKLEPWAQEIADRLNSYTEVTPSGTGIRIICRGELPVGRRKEGPIEVYETERYITVTGAHLVPFPKRIRRCPNAVREVYDKLFSPSPQGNGQDQHTEGGLDINPDKILQESLLVLLSYSTEHAKKIRDSGLKPSQFEGGEFRQIATELYKHLDRYDKTAGEHLEDLFEGILTSRTRRTSRRRTFLEKFCTTSRTIKITCSRNL